jgi:hypothetical protein
MLSDSLCLTLLAFCAREWGFFRDGETRLCTVFAAVTSAPLDSATNRVLNKVFTEKFAPKVFHTTKKSVLVCGTGSSFLLWTTSRGAFRRKYNGSSYFVKTAVLK